MKVLIIDDDKSIADMFRTIFDLKGMSSVISYDGKRGLELIESRCCDVVLLDLAMPDFSGYDIINTLEKNGTLREHKIVVVTASDMTNDTSNDLKSRGVFSVLQKPVNIDLLLDVLQTRQNPIILS